VLRQRDTGRTPNFVSQKRRERTQRIQNFLRASTLRLHIEIVESAEFMSKRTDPFFKAHEALRQIHDGNVSMTRDSMLAVLWTFIYVGSGPFTSYEDGERWEAEWLSVAQPEWIDILLNIGLHPPDDIDSVREIWDLDLQLYMEAIAVRFPLYALHKIVQAIQEERTRGQVIGQLLGKEYDEAPEWCKTLVRKSDQLSRADILRLVEVLNVVANTEAQSLLRQPGPRVQQSS
jgi:hypothetical protein